MNYEKLYKNALERAEKVKQNDNLKSLHRVIDIIFPELKDSEDEKIRKALIKGVSRIIDGHTLFDTDVTKEEALAWLEKQRKEE